jgi:hypothetical protein
MVDGGLGWQESHWKTPELYGTPSEDSAMVFLSRATAKDAKASYIGGVCEGGSGILNLG